MGFLAAAFGLQAINYRILIEVFGEHWAEGVVDVEEDALHGVAQFFVNDFSHSFLSIRSFPNSL